MASMNARVDMLAQASNPADVATRENIEKVRETLRAKEPPLWDYHKLMCARAQDEGWPTTTRVTACPRCGVIHHTMIVRCTNCATKFKYFGVVQHEQYTFGEENALRPPEPKPKRKPRTPSASPAPAKATEGRKLPPPHRHGLSPAVASSVKMRWLRPLGR